MRKSVILILLVFGIFFIGDVSGTVLETTIYEGTSIVERKVDQGHQGVCTDGTNWYVMGTTSITKYDSNWEMIERNSDPFSDGDFLGTDINHLGDCTYYDGLIYTFGKNQSSCGSNTNHRFLLYNTSNLSYDSYNSTGDEAQYQIFGGPAIDSENGIIYAGKCGDASNELYKFNLTTFEHLSNITLDTTFDGGQGLFYKSDNLYFSSGVLGILEYNLNGEFQRNFFKAYVDLHEGIDYSTDILTLAYTSNGNIGESGYYILQTNLTSDIYRYVDANGNDSRESYTFATAKKTLYSGGDGIAGVFNANYLTTSGQTILISNYTKTNPYRYSLEDIYFGTADYPKTYQGQGDGFYIIGSENFSETADDSKWTESIETSGEYYLTEDDDTQKTSTEVKILATTINWNNNGLEELIKRVNGIAGTLGVGEWDWADNDSLGFNTIYYKPASGENISTVHIEAGQRDYVVDVSDDYGIFKNFKIFMSNTDTVNLAGNNNIFERSSFAFSAGFYGNLRIGNSDNIIKNSISRGALRGYYILSTGDNTSIYNSVAYGNANAGFNIESDADNVTLKNNIAMNSTNQFSIGTVVNFIAEYNLWNGTNNAAFNTYISGHDVGNLNNQDPLFTNVSANDFTLQSTSPCINNGTSIFGITTDYNSNGRYDEPDIGAYEYQPPYDILSDTINLSISDKIRIYADGKYRHINSTTSIINANLIIQPIGGFSSTNYSQWMDLNITSWTSSLMNWSESSDNIGSSSVTHTICDLSFGSYYEVYYIKSGTRTLLSRHAVDSSGCVVFNYAQGYSTIIFDMQPYTPATTEETPTPPSGGGYPVYTINNNQFQEGYSKSLGKGWTAKFEFGDETHEIKIDDIQNNSATITILSTPQTKTLEVGEEWKVNLDDDNYYDLLVRLDNVTSIRANIFVQKINEEIEAGVIDKNKSITQEGTIKDGDYFGEINGWYYIGAGIVLVLFIVIFFIGKKHLRKNKFFN